MYQTEEDDQGKLSHLCLLGKVGELMETEQAEVVVTISDTNFQTKRREGRGNRMTSFLPSQ